MNKNEKGKFMIKNNSLGDQLPIWHFDGDLLVFSDGSLGAGFEIEGFDASSSSTDEINDLSQNLENMITSLPEGFSLQIFYKMSSDSRDIVKHHAKNSSGASEVCKKIAQNRIKFLNENQERGRHFLPQIYLFVKSRPFHHKRVSLFQRDTRFISMNKKDYDAHKKSFDRVLNRIESEAAFLSPQRLSEEEWFRLLFEYFNPDRGERIGTPKLRKMETPFSPTLTEQLLLTDVKVCSDALKIGAQYLSVITMKNLPEESTHAFMGKLLAMMPLHFRIGQNIHIPDQKTELSKLQLERRMSHAMISGGRDINDLESESKFTHTEELMRELVEGSEKLVSSDLNVVIHAKSKRELAEKEDEVLKVFRMMNGAEGVRETLPLFNLFVSIFPGNCGGIRHKKMKSSNAAHIMPIQSWWKGNRAPVCLMPNREGMPFSLDPFAPELPNWNALVFGGSGSGKSFTVAQLMLQFHGRTPTPKIVWIDNGASSKNLTEVLGGTFVDLGLDSGICINMFDLGSGERLPDSSKTKLILAVLESIFKDEEHQGIPKREKALLEEAILTVYKKSNGKTPTLSDLREFLANHDAKEMRTYSDILYSWTGESGYGKILDGKTNIRPEKNLVSIEMKGLDAHPDLQNVLMLIITDYIRREASEDLSTPYLLIIDEGWKLFETTGGLGFVAEAFRTFRKFNAGIWCISQNYRDFMADEEIKNALFPNTSSLFILRQTKIDWNDFQESFDFNEEEMAVIKSLKFEKGNYSEFFFIQDDNKAVLRLIPDPLSYWICTTDGGDKAIIAGMEKENPDISKTEVLEAIVDANKQEKKMGKSMEF